jgi:DNA-binding MarR family transcriptional regulator
MWSFFTNHARVLACIAQDPRARLREIGDAVGITERAAHRIVNELCEAGYVSRERSGRRNVYEIHLDASIQDLTGSERELSDFLRALAGQRG